jgi:uncharacterized protein (TIGR02677 family)
VRDCGLLDGDMSDSSPPRPFAHVDAPNSRVYRRIMRVFAAAKRRFVVHLRPEDVTELLRSDGGPALAQEQVEDALKSLEEWGNLRADPDTSRVTTVEDFYRARFLYQLSREGEAAERALEVYEQEIGRRGELQAVALEDIRVRLRAMRDLAEHPDPAVVHNLLLELIARLDSLAANASAFMGSLQRTIDLHEVDEQAFLAYKDRLIAYLERFVSELVTKQSDIAGTLRQIARERVTYLLSLAVEREAADASPDDETTHEQRMEAWRERWSGLESWFARGDRQHPSQAELLRARARKAIPDLLATVSVLQERRAGVSNRSADFRTLARWFAQAESDEEAHTLWRMAFGLSSARHLGLDAGAELPDVPASTPWLDAPRAQISARLRTTGSYQRRGGPSKVRDRTEAKRALAAEIEEEQRQTERAKASLATGEPTLLSRMSKLDRQEFRLFLRLLGDALAATDPAGDGTVTTRTSDGTLEITLSPRDGYAELYTEDGIMRGPDYEITIRDVLG